jgi:hypothetical protein
MLDYYLLSRNVVIIDKKKKIFLCVCYLQSDLLDSLSVSTSKHVCNVMYN